MEVFLKICFKFLMIFRSTPCSFFTAFLLKWPQFNPPCTLFPRLALSSSFPPSPRASSHCSQSVSCVRVGVYMPWCLTQGSWRSRWGTSRNICMIKDCWAALAYARVTLCSRPIRREFERERDVFKRHSSDLPLSLKVSSVQSWKMLYDPPWERAQISCSIWILFWSCNWGS